jgi:crotonobetainyl-CoA:carnitine CoA-transferase CaiB-like acyl-CoA transferase
VSVLAGVRVVELANFISAPFACQLLADFGAEVIKIERPGQPDQSRTAGGLHPADAQRSPYFATGLGRNKRSVCLDLAADDDFAALLELLRTADVMAENFTPGTLERWGLDWPRLHELNPRLVLVRISGYGQSGPLRDRPSVDRTAQAFAGLAHLTGQSGEPPVPAGLAVADYSAGYLAALGALLALRERDSSGLGQVVDVSLYDALLPMLCEIPAEFGCYGRARTRSGDYYPGSPLMTIVRSKDGAWLQIAVLGPEAFRRFAAAFGQAQVAQDPRFGSAEGQDRHRVELRELVGNWVAGRTAREVGELCDAARIPCAPVQDFAQLYEHPHVVARGDFITVPDDDFGSVPAVGVIPRLSRAPGSVVRAGPQPDQDRELLTLTPDEPDC